MIEDHRDASLTTIRLNVQSKDNLSQELQITIGDSNPAQAADLARRLGAACKESLAVQQRQADPANLYQRWLSELDTLKQSEQESLDRLVQFARKNMQPQQKKQVFARDAVGITSD